jgi:murein DD-endopeptidase MepM/ murein hydrolase activator NlpD
LEVKKSSIHNGLTHTRHVVMVTAVREVDAVGGYRVDSIRDDDHKSRRLRVQAIRRCAQRFEVADSAAPLQRHPAATVASAVLTPKSWRREHVVLASLFATVTTLVAAIAPGFANATRQSIEPVLITQPLALPDIAEVVDPAASPAPGTPSATLAASPLPESDWQLVTVKPGQTLGDIFESLGLPVTAMHRLLDHPGAREPLTRIRPGTQFKFDIPAAGELRAVRFDRDEASRVTLTLRADTIEEQVQQRDLQQRVQMAGGEIEDSLFGAGTKAGLSNGAIIELAKVFGYDIDFAQDLRVGDRFSVVYEEIYRDGERLRAGDILSATFINQGKRYTAFRYEFADGRAEYFDADGRPLKKSFLRIPVEFTRISSLFSAARKHPILGRTRAHQGVDYAAGSGTPIMAAGEGRISFAGWKNGYGRTVIVDHGRGYTTLYGHMSRFGKAKTGARVRQGETIGFVGMSGLASGPHLHYEFRINGSHRDPLKVTLPKPEPLPHSELARFRLQTQPMLAKLQLLEGGHAYASR